MDALVFGFKLLTISEAMNMSLGDIEAWYNRAVDWFEQRQRDVNKEAKRKR